MEGVSAETVFDRGWSSLTNGELLQAAAPDFDAFLTADQNLPYQQNLLRFTLRVVVLAARTNRWDHLLPLIPKALDACHRLKDGEVAVIRSARTDGGFITSA